MCHINQKDKLQYKREELMNLLLFLYSLFQVIVCFLLNLETFQSRKMKNIKINICINIGCENFIYTIFMIRATFWESSSIFF